MNKSTAIVILSFDGYSDLWETYFTLMKKYWRDVKYPVYLVTNNLRPNYEGVKILNVGEEISWSSRARKAINMINEENIILMLEDYFIGADVSSEEIDDLVNYTETEKIDYLRIVPIPKPISNKNKLNGIYPLSEKNIYGVNLQASIWKKEFLIKTLGSEDFGAWEFENRQKIESPYRVKGNCATVDYWPIKILNGVIQGKWFGETLSYFEGKGIEIDRSNREVMSKKDVSVMKIRKILLHKTPVQIQKKIKPFLKKIGFKFVT